MKTQTMRLGDAETRRDDARPGMPLSALEEAEAIWLANKRRRAALEKQLADDEVCRMLGIAEDPLPRDAHGFRIEAWTPLERWTFAMVCAAAGGLCTMFALGVETPDLLLILTGAAGLTGLALWLIGSFAGFVRRR